MKNIHITENRVFSDIVYKCILYRTFKIDFISFFLMKKLKLILDDHEEYKMENIVTTYLNVLKYFNKYQKVLSVSYEHKDRKICFDSVQREILYSIRDYFKYLLKKDFTTYTETA